jgi:molybdopterin-guanine dinucleotide biosynthesis protein A
MSAVEANYYFIIPCDTPMVTKKITEEILSLKQQNDIVVPITKNHQIHPLIGIYSRSVLPIIKKQIDLGNYKVLDLLSVCNTFYHPVDDHGILKNINIKEDLE